MTHPRPAHPRNAAIVLLIALVLAGCSSKKASSNGLPVASTLLQQSAAVMKDVTTAHVTLKVDGTLSPLPVKSADGVIARGGKAKATAIISVLGTSVTYQIIETGGTTYLKGPTGGFTSVSTASIYDVSLLLDPDKGVASLLSQATDGSTIGREPVNGEDTYKLTASVPTAVVKGLADLAPGEDRVTATLWIEVSSNRLLQAAIPLMINGLTKITTVTADLSDFNAPVDISAPATP